MKNPFKPAVLPFSLKKEDIIEIYRLENLAMQKISKFNTMLERSVIKEDILIIFSLNESVQSTKIEGTQATLSEVIEADITGKKNIDITEVINYSKAMFRGEELLKTLPLSTRLFNELHLIIMENSRGKNRNPGHYRTSQNFIGPTNKIEDATYIPPEPQHVNDYMSNLEKYINDEIEDDFGKLARAAIIHGQFETIHPYCDGNGRLGRVLIVLYLLSNDIIDRPAFFLSTELEKNKFKYYALLNGLRKNTTPSWKEWIIFFVQSTISQADNYIEKLISIEGLYEMVASFSKEANIKNEAVLAIFKNPYISIKRMQENAGVSYNTARKYLSLMTQAGFLYPNDKARNKIYYFYDLIDLIK